MRFFDRVAQFTATTGQGTITLGTAINNTMLTLAEAGAVDGDEITFLLEEGDSVEISRGVVGAGATTVTRAAVQVSKIGGVAGAEKMELAGNAKFRVIETAASLNRFENNIGFQAVLPEIIRNAGWTATPAEAGRMLVYNSAVAGTVTLPPVADSQGEVYHYRCANTGTLMIDGNGVETVEGAATLALPQGVSALVWANEGKTAWRAMTIWGPLSFASPQSLTAAQKGQARANIGADLLGGFRNKIINGDFDIWQRGTNIAAGGYTADRWIMNWGAGAAGAVSKQGGAVAYGNMMAFARVTRSTLGTAVSRFYQKIESVWTLGGKTATLSFWARSTAPSELRTALVQVFGTGGSPSADVATPAAVHSLTTTWQKFQQVVSLGGVAGKTRGSNNDDNLQVRFDWLTTAPNPLTDVDIAHVSLVEGDATAETDPFSPRHLQQELALCQRYCYVEPNRIDGHGVRYGSAGSNREAGHVSFPVLMRAVPTVLAGTATPSFENCSDLQWGTISTRCAIPRVTVTATNAYRCYGGAFTFDAEL